jgi:arylsulfatase A-like enzyme
VKPIAPHQEVAAPRAGGGRAARAAGGFLLGGLAGIATGLLTALFDAVLSRFAFGADPTRAELLRHLSWALALFGVAGAATGFLFACAARRSAGRTVFAMTSAGLLFLLGATANILWLPGFLRPVSLAVDAVLLAVVLVVLRLATRGTRRFTTARFWTGLLLLGGLCAGIHWLLASPGPSAPEVRGANHPSVLLVVIDSLRADHTTPGGYERDTTPHLSALAKESAWFRLARAAAPWTKPSAATILTGLPPAVHGAEDEWDVLPPEALSIAEVLKAAGYDTALFSDNIYVRTRFGFSQGFDRVHEPVPGSFVERHGPSSRTLLGRVLRQVDGEIRTRFPGRSAFRSGASRIADLFLEWIADREPERPWFAYLHLMDSHEPWQAPPPFDALFSGRPQPGPLAQPPLGGLPPLVPGEVLPEAERQSLVDAQDSAVAFVDDVLDRLIDEVERRVGRENLVLVVTADHGEAFYEHAAWGHRHVLHEEVLHVPLIVRRPDHAPAVIDRPVSLGSLAATIVEAAGYRPPADFLRFAEPLFDGSGGPSVHLARLHYLGSEGHAVIDGHRKVLRVTRGDREAIQVFDLAEDPGETAPVLERGDPRRAAAHAEIEARFEGHRRAALGRGERADTRDLTEALRGLGYLR